MHGSLLVRTYVRTVLQHNLTPKIQQLCTTDMHDHRQQTLLEYVLECTRTGNYKPSVGQ